MKKIKITKGHNLKIEGVPSTLVSDIKDPEKISFHPSSIKNFKTLRNLTSNKIIGILGTGPSYDIARDYYKENNLEIVSCNSSIYDDELWNSGCKIFCFADPVFHFGTS